MHNKCMGLAKQGLYASDKKYMIEDAEDYDNLTRSIF